MTPRGNLASVAVAAMVLTAGCGFIAGSEPLTFGAQPATVSGDTLSETGYEETTVTEQVVTENVTVAEQTRQIEVTNQLARYERQVDLGPLGSEPAAVFVAFASPEVEVATQTFNPIADLSEREILQRFGSGYQRISVDERVDAQTVSVLGQSVTVEKFTGTADLGGTEVSVYVHAAKLKDGDDYVVAVAIYPQRLDGEGERVVALLGGLEHETEE